MPKLSLAVSDSNPTRTMRRREAGYVLLTTLLTMLLITSLAIVYFVMANRDVLIAGHYWRENQAFHAADAGVTVVTNDILTSILNAAAPPTVLVPTDVNPADANVKYAYCVNANCANPPANLTAMTDNAPPRAGWATNLNFGPVGFYVEATGTTTDGASTTIETYVRGMVNKKTYYGGT